MFFRAFYNLSSSKNVPNLPSKNVPNLPNLPQLICKVYFLQNILIRLLFLKSLMTSQKVCTRVSFQKFYGFCEKNLLFLNN